MKILLSVDGSDHTRRMLAYLAAHNELLGPGHAYLAFTTVVLVPTQVTQSVEKASIQDYYQAQADDVLRPVQAFAAQQGWNLRTAFTAGHAAEEIARVVETEKPDLVVMGTHGHTALANAILGSVASGVLARCRVPVLLIR